jgi:hypothetical protein
MYPVGIKGKINLTAYPYLDGRVYELIGFAGYYSFPSCQGILFVVVRQHWQILL